jgi:pyridoxine 4-dehydrogenase
VHPVRSDHPEDYAAHTRSLGPFLVSPIGLGAMRLAGPNVFGPPEDRRAALAVLREAVDRGVDHIDTAQYYGPAIVNELIREALYPYPPELVLVSKVGARRDRSGRVLIDDEPAQLRRGIEENLRTLGLHQLPVVNLRLMRRAGPDALFDDQLAAMIAARDAGAIGAIGLSNTSVAHLLHAVQSVQIACVQNAFHLLNRSSQPVLDECTRRGIAFVPFAPLGSGQSGSDSALGMPEVAQVAARRDCTPAQVALAWSLAMSPTLLAIPGTSSLGHLHENLAASSVHLDAEDLRRLTPV